MLTLDNFFEASLGLWTEIRLIPEDYLLLRQGKQSTYYLSPDKQTVVRVSNHWGSGIAQCNWYLQNYPRRNAYHWRWGKRIGTIRLSELIDIRLPEIV